MSTIHFVDNKETEKYFCAICQDIMTNPSQIGCTSSHVFCKECINQFMSQTNDWILKCPICTTPFVTNSVVEIPFIQRQINDLKVKCSHSNHISMPPPNNNNQINSVEIHNSNNNKRRLQLANNSSKKRKLNESENCDWIGAWSDLNNHIKICPFEVINCEYAINGCKHKIKRKDMKLHTNNCEYMQILCSKCKQKTVSRKQLSYHLSHECIMRMVKCKFNGCNKQMKQKYIDKHEKYECGYTMIECKYMEYGCIFIQRKDNESHNKQYAEKHLQLIEQNHSKLKQELTKTTNKIKQLNKENETLTKENIALKYNCPKCNYSLIGISSGLLNRGEIKCSTCGCKKSGTVWYCKTCPHWIVCCQCRYS
eukprot:303346_1